MTDFIHAELSGDRVWLRSDFRYNELVKKVSGTKWDAEHRLWWAPVSWTTCVQMRGVFKEKLQIGEALAAWAMREVSTRVEPCMELRDAAEAMIPGGLVPDGFALEPRQSAGVAFLAAAKQALQGDSMGSGKTIQTIVALELLASQGEEPFPCLVICPNSMKLPWAKELAKWAPHRTVGVITGGAAARRKIIAEGHDFLVINWEGLRSHTRLASYGYIKLSDAEKEQKELNAAGLQTVVADEAHRAKNPRAKQTRAAWYVSHQAAYRFALTGTPIASSPEDAWSILHMIAPHEWPSKSRFIDRYALQSWSPFGHMNIVGIRGETREEFLKILDPRFIRRPTKLVVPDLLDKLPPQVREVELGSKQRKAYDDLKKHLLAELDGGVLMATNPLTRLLRLQQLAAAYGELQEDGSLVLKEPSAKIDALEDLLEEIGDEQAVVFAESRQLIELASRRLAKLDVAHGMITGGVSTADRQVYIDQFQAGEIRCILATLGAGGEGLTLTAARFGVFLQRSFSMVKNLQAEARVWRKGQEREVQIIDLVAADTVEAHVLEVGEDKRDRLEELCRDEETLRRWLS